MDEVSKILSDINTIKNYKDLKRIKNTVDFRLRFNYPVKFFNALFWSFYSIYGVFKYPCVSLLLFISNKLKILKNRKSIRMYRSKLRLGVPREDLK